MKRLLLILILLALLCTLYGCIMEPAENLYAVPQQPEEFYDLQRAIEKVMPNGVSYAPPVSGENQQAVQLADLNGDGEEEVIVYLKGSGEAPLSLCVFERQEGEYFLLTQINCGGSAFDHVQYVEMDGTAGYELVVGRRISEQLTRIVNVYSLGEDGLTELLSADYSQFITTDLDGDGLTDLVLLRTAGDMKNGIAEYYHWRGDQLAREMEAGMSTTAGAIKRIITGKMCEAVPAVFVASEYEEDTIVTDIFGYIDGNFVNLALPMDLDTGVRTVRKYYVYSSDIDNDGLIELPQLVPLQSLPGDSSSEDQSLIRWYNLQLDGTVEEKELTFHNYFGGWYVRIPEQWEQSLTVSRVTVLDTVLGYRFSLLEKGESRELFTIVALTGEHWQQTLDTAEDWEKLTEKGEVLYACRLGEPNLTVEDLREMFRFIHIDWKTGETAK